MNKRIDLTNLGGFPLGEDTLDFMQQSYRDAFKAMASLCGDKSILTGVVVAIGAVSDGWISYGGELIPFVGGAAADQVVIQELPALVKSIFNDGASRDVYFTKFASCGVLGNFPFSDLKRIKTLVTPTSYNDLTDVPVEAAVSYNDLTNLPAAKFTYKTSLHLGDVGVDGSYDVHDSAFTINIPDQGNANYIVTGSLVGLSANPHIDNQVMWIVTNKTNNAFTIEVGEIFGNTQNLQFDFAIIN